MKKRLLFLIHTLGGGGAEKALVNLVNNMNAEKYDITVQTMFGDGINAKSLKPHIKYISKKAPCPKGISFFLRFVSSSSLYRYFIGKDKYDILIAYMHGAPVKVISGNKEAPKIAWLHNGNPETSTMFSCWFSKNKAFEAYRSCNAIAGVSKSVSDAFSKYTGISENVCVVHNTLDTHSIILKAKESVDIEIDSNIINLVSTGRLGKEKGYARLIDICTRLKEEGYLFKLYLIGDGSEKENLIKQIKSNSLDDTVFLLGYQENPYKYVNKCDVFVCSSYTEGLSTATIEALILGKAIVSTDVSGAYEILGENDYGLMVENSDEGIYKGLKLYLDNRSLINKYKDKANQRAYFFDIKNTVDAAEAVIDKFL